MKAGLEQPCRIIEIIPEEAPAIPDAPPERFPEETPADPVTPEKVPA